MSIFLVHSIQSKNIIFLNWTVQLAWKKGHTNKSKILQPLLLCPFLQFRPVQTYVLE